MNTPSGIAERKSYGTEDAIFVLERLVAQMDDFRNSAGELHADNQAALLRIEQALFLIRGAQEVLAK